MCRLPLIPPPPGDRVCQLEVRLVRIVCTLRLLLSPGMQAGLKISKSKQAAQNLGNLGLVIVSLLGWFLSWVGEE